MNNLISEIMPGDIISGANNKNKSIFIRPHYIIFLADINNSVFFHGAMLTHAARFGNIKMEINHFETHNTSEDAWGITYHNSFMAKNLLRKKNEWAPFTQVGKLTSEGLDFVLGKLAGQVAIDSPLNR
jgi:hypothetical protein